MSFLPCNTNRETPLANILLGEPPFFAKFFFHGEPEAEAADFEVVGTDNAELADWIYKNLEFDQLILEYYKVGEPNSGWIHCSICDKNPRKQFLHAYRSEGKTKYKPVIGKAKDLV